MELAIADQRPNYWIKSIVLYLLALSTVYFTPALTHLFSLPIYFIEPMRLMIILALAHTKKENAYLLALTLPIFSYLVSGHPLLPKMFLITFELALNVFLYTLLAKKIRNALAPALLSILAAKAVYYGIKYILVGYGILNMGIISTPVYMQIITILAFSSYIYIILSAKHKETKNSANQYA